MEDWTCDLTMLQNHENKEVKRNVVKGILTMVLAGKCNLKEKK